jgi:hypothetical protein
MSVPVMTFHAAGNLFAPAPLGAGASTTFDVDYSGKVEGFIQIAATFGAAVDVVSGIQIDIRRRIGVGNLPDTQSAGLPGFVAAIASTTQRKSFPLTTGRYQIRLTNLDAVNGVTDVGATDDSVDSYQ